uniref:Uncharacterized protein n=1 Tax=Glossina pallidipes TaxID=7398 RepID=A0A1B0AEC6_GLOPL
MFLPLSYCNLSGAWRAHVDRLQDDLQPYPMIIFWSTVTTAFCSDFVTPLAVAIFICNVKTITEGFGVIEIYLIIYFEFFPSAFNSLLILRLTIYFYNSYFGYMIIFWSTVTTAFCSDVIVSSHQTITLPILLGPGDKLLLVPLVGQKTFRQPFGYQL